MSTGGQAVVAAVNATDPLLEELTYKDIDQLKEMTLSMSTKREYRFVSLNICTGNRKFLPINLCIPSFIVANVFAFHRGPV